MKWVMLVVSVILLAIAYKTIIYDRRHPKADTPRGTAEVFVKAAVEGNLELIAQICEPAVKARALQVAQELRAVMPPDLVLMWQAQRPTRGQRAFAAQITGKGRVIVVEINQHGNAYMICKVDLPSF